MFKQTKLIEKIKRIGVICALWIICLFFYQLIIYFTIEEVAPEKAKFVQLIVSGFILGLLFGLTNGFLEVVIFRERFKRLKFGYTVLLKTSLFIITFIATVFLFILITDYILAPAGLFEEPDKNNIAEFFGSSEFYKHGLYAVLFCFGINFFLQIDNKMGKNVLFNLFFGRFHSPRKQEKIIMFLDLTSSTTIAEKIGDYKYSAFLKNFFYDLDEIISETKGAVYQYVGDEVVIVWDVKDGIDNNNCIKCYYESKKSIYEKKNKYKELYSEVPQFKAGIHLGEVVVTEVGGLKSEIAYHGDTINTASRLCAEAQNYGNGLLISAELLGFLKYMDEFYRIESVGLVKFKGKRHDIAAFSVYEKG
jgi:adenylate cyclase